MNSLTVCLSSLLILATCFTASTSGFGFRAVSRRLACEGEETFALHEDCTKYYVCSNNQPVLAECPENLFFDPVEGYCNFPEEVEDCVGGTRDPGSDPVTDPSVPPQPTTPADPGTTPAATLPPTTADPVTTPEATPPPTTADPVTTPAPTPPPTEPQPETTTSAPGICPPDGIDYFPFPGDCQKYYICVNGEETVMTCAEGTLYDPALKKCNVAEEVTCAVTVPPTTEAPPPTTSQPVTCPVDGVDYLPDPTDCQKYYLCANGLPIPQTCADGLLFDPDTKQCRLASEVECNVGPKCPADGISYFPVEGSCTEYTMCVSGQAIAKECAPGTEFDPQAQECVLDANYECPFNVRISAFAFLSRFFH